MLDQNDRMTLGRHAFQQVVDLASGVFIQLGGRLVQNQERGLAGKGRGHRDTLLLTPGEIVRGTVR